MARTSSSAVKSILMEDYDKEAEPSLSPFIETANSLTTRVASTASTNGNDLSVTELELIERWLAAHFYKMSDKAYAENTTADAEAVYDGKTDKGLEASLYGQTALVLDWTGTLVQMSRHNRARGLWLGKTETESLTWEQRNL